MQVRYGWTDEIIHGLLYARFLQLVQLSVDALNKEGKERLILAAFIGWQMGAGGKKNFGSYLDGLGLSDIPSESVAPIIDKEAADAKLKRHGIVPKKGKKR